MIYRRRGRGLLAAVLAAAILAVLIDAPPALAATPCYASSCDGLSPVSSSIESGCGTFVAYGGANNEDEAQITIMYSKTCHAAYAKTEIESDSVEYNTIAFYMPQYGGSAKVTGSVVSDGNVLTTLVSWDYSFKSCFSSDVVGNFADPDPWELNDSPYNFCTRWV